jgi:hypothetical protein
VTLLVPLLFFALAGFLLGGAYSLNRQAKPKPVIVGLALAGVLCAVVGVLYL